MNKGLAEEFCSTLAGLTCYEVKELELATPDSQIVQLFGSVSKQAVQLKLTAEGRLGTLLELKVGVHSRNHAYESIQGCIKRLDALIEAATQEPKA
jgi:hypothetical protein